MALDKSKLEWCTNGAQPISILSDDPRLGLFIGTGLILIILVLAALGIIIKKRWHAAHYYTHEAERPEIPTPPVPPSGMMGEIEANGNNGGFDNLYYNNGNYKSNNKWNKMIATIDEIHSYVDTPYPELENSLQRHHHIVDDGTNIMLPPPSSYR